MNKLIQNTDYCMVSFKDKDNPKILKIQGITWFESEDLAYDYYMMLNEEHREENVYPVQLENLSFHFNVGDDYVQGKLKETRVSKDAEHVGVMVGVEI